MKLRQKILSIALAMACTVSFCAGATTVGAVSYSRQIKYDGYLYYKQVDDNNDGTFDYIEISDCETYDTEVIIPTEIGC